MQKTVSVKPSGQQHIAPHRRRQFFALFPVKLFAAAAAAVDQKAAVLISSQFRGGGQRPAHQQRLDVRQSERFAIVRRFPSVQLQAVKTAILRHFPHQSQRCVNKNPHPLYPCKVPTDHPRLRRRDPTPAGGHNKPDPISAVGFRRQRFLRRFHAANLNQQANHPLHAH